MEKLNFKKICRICMNEGSMMSLFKVSMYKKVMAIASIQVWPNDGLPSQICTRCASKLHIAFQLKKQCERSDLKLRQYQAVVPQAEDKKGINEAQPNVHLIENGITQPLEAETATHKIYIQQNNEVLIENVRPQHNYDHFMTVQANDSISQVTFANLTPDGQIQMPTYNIQPHLVYTTQYSLPTEQIITNTPVQQTQVELNAPQVQNELKECESNENSKKINSDKNTLDGKACPTCGKVFRTNIKLNRHLKIHTTLPSDLPHKCQVCGKGFSHAGNFKIHLRIHNNERPFKCPVCNKGCRQAQDLEKHMRTHTGERPHKCSYCPKAFATSSNLTAHIRTHTGERPYVCSVCPKAFCQSNELTKHMRTHTGEKSHICDICNKGFNGSSGLLTHRRQHTGERPYLCPHCNRSFTSSNCLSAHVKTHNKLYPLNCAQCDQSFRTLSNLKDHLTTNHSSGEIIQCKMCDTSFNRVNDYLVHVRKHECDS
ncbi:hypothetical protein ABEB36_010243 [Hypothenemus hampei]|uniref:Uncharacterized protein n=1 Tax=Hypothenemus hampei TaxID=57062 RepID=A0ABD1EL21_HYPHA